MTGPGKEADTAPLRGVVLCGRVQASCTCIEKFGHDEASTPHRCECGGSWRGRAADGNFEVVEWPGPWGPVFCSLLWRVLREDI